MTDIAVRAEGLGKKYRIGARVKASQNLSEALGNMLYAPVRRIRARAQRYTPDHDTIWALKDVSFEIKRGEVVGIIGHNGAGKTTLLKILTRITSPTEGCAQIYGRVSSLLEVGTGFHQELTGRENIYLNGAVLGMKNSEINRKFDQIVEFSGVEQFIDTPVKRYSAGMKMRLAFSVAAHLEPDVLLVDEVLAVGDAEFQKKCMGTMEEVSGQGRTVLFVSHNMNALLRLCPESLLLAHGRLVARGDTQNIIRQYLGSQVAQEGVYEWQWSDEQRERASYFLPRALRIKDHEGAITNRVDSAKAFFVEVEYEITQNAPNLKLGVLLSTGQGELFGICWDQNVRDRTPGVYLSRCAFPPELFAPGGLIVGLYCGIPGLKNRIFHNPELIKLYIGGSTELSNLGAPILRPAFDWTIQRLEP